MDYREPTAADFNVDPPRQIGHPSPRIGIQLARCQGEPCGRKPLTSASRWETAAAIGGAFQPRRLAQDGPRGFEIAVWAPEYHQGAIDTKQRNRSRHDAFSIIGSRWPLF